MVQQWFEKNKRGSVLAYVGVGGLYKPWYSGWADSRDWRVERTMGINAEELSKLMETGRLIRKVKRRRYE